MQYKKNDAFYDFEVLANLITLAAYQPKTNILYLGYETHTENTQGIANLQEVLDATPNWKEILKQKIREINTFNIDRLTNINIIPLRELTDMFLAWSNQNNKNKDNIATIFGFNSQHYDVPILADISVSYIEDKQITTENIRATSDRIIVDKISPYKLFERGSMKQVALQNLQKNPSFLDVQIINEKLRHTGLKRLSAQAGLKILTSQKLKDGDPIVTFEDMCELIAYNVSDVFNTQDIFESKDYQNPYNTGVSMLERYKEQFKGLNLKRDTTSAKFIEYVIAPSYEDKLHDDKYLQLRYPMYNGYLHGDGKQRIKLMIDGYNKKFEPKFDTNLDYDLQENFEPFIRAYLLQIIKKESGNEIKDPTDAYLNNTIELILNRDAKTANNYEAIRPIFEYEKGHRKIYFKDDEIQIDLVEYLKYNYIDKFNKKYHTTEYNDLYEYLNAFNNNDVSDKKFRTEIANNLPIQLKTGANILMPNNKPVILKVSVGGAHGNFLDRENYEKALNANMQFNENLNKIKDYYINLAEQVINQNFVDPENSLLPELEKPEILDLDPADLAPLLAKYTKKKPTKKSVSGGFAHNEPYEIRQLVPSDYVTGTYKEAKFKSQKAIPKTNNYTETIDSKNAVHIDISSYYPTLLSLLKVFISNKVDENGNRIDLYGELLKHRLKIKFSLPADITTWTEEDFLNKAIELLDKLLLNSASGAADATYDNNILVPNKIMRMRLAGQIIITILSFLISEADGVPNSINTDGVYSHDIDLDTANNIIKDWAKTFKLDADGELIDHFISKDSNNRIEIVYSKKAKSLVVASASGGTIGHHEGPDLQKNVALPTIVDNALVEYLFKQDRPLEHFDRDKVKSYIQKMIDDCIAECDSYQPEFLAEFNKPDSDPTKNVKGVLKKITDISAKTLMHFQHIVVSNANKQRFITFTDNNGKPVYPSDINRVFFIDPDVAQEYRDDESSRLFKSNEEYPTKMRLVVVNKQVKKTNEEAQKVAEETGLLEKQEVKEALEAKSHISFMAITNIEDDWVVTRQNQDLRYIPLALLSCLDVDVYTDLVKIQWDNWADLHKTNY